MSVFLVAIHLFLLFAAARILSTTLSLTKTGNLGLVIIGLSDVLNEFPDGSFSGRNLFSDGYNLCSGGFKSAQAVWRPPIRLEIALKFELGLL